MCGVLETLTDSSGLEPSAILSHAAAAVVKKHVAKLEAVFALAAIVVAPEFSVAPTA